MNFKEFLNLVLIKTDDYTLTVYQLMIILVILVITRTLLWTIKKILKGVARKRNLDEGKSHSFYQLIKYFLWTGAIIMSLDSVKIDITIFLAGSAALLVGIGLGLQQIFQDFLSGLSILFEGTIKVNDVVEIEGSIVGRVKEIGLRTSKIETRDNIVMIVPNSRFVNEIVINWTHAEKRTRFYVKVGVAYGSDVEKVSELLVDAAKSHRLIAEIPEPFVKFIDFGESSLDFEILFWSNKTFEVEKIKSDLRFAINKAFIQNNITIPFPQRDLHIKSKAQQ